MNEVQNIISLRLHLVKLYYNYAKKNQCSICREEEETTEHVLECSRIVEIVRNMKVNDMYVKPEDLSELIKMVNYITKVCKKSEEQNMFWKECIERQQFNREYG